MFESMNESLFQLMEIVTEDFAQLAELKTAIKRENSKRRAGVQCRIFTSDARLLRFLSRGCGAGGSAHP